MAIIQGETTSFRIELMGGIHDFTTDVFKVAVFTSSATLDNDTTAYSTTNETTGTGYTAGGTVVTITAPAVEGLPDDIRTVFIDATDAVWDDSSFTGRAALLYNSSKSNKAVAVYDFGVNRTSDGGPFRVRWPVPAAATAMLRIEDPA